MGENQNEKKSLYQIVPSWNVNTERQNHPYISKISMWAYNLIVNNIVRSKHIFVENNKIE